MPNVRTAALGAMLLVLFVGACTSSGTTATSSTTTSLPPASGVPSDATHSAPSAPTIASTFALGGPPECPQRPFCLLGLQETYGLQFKEFIPLDTAGPLTIQALIAGQIQIGMLLTSDPAIVTNGFVLLQDDKHLQLADNIVPVVRKEILDADPGVATVLNTVISRLTQEELTELNKAVTIDLKSVTDVARDWIAAQGFDSMSAGIEGKIVVGSTNFYEQEILGEIFAQSLASNGATVERKFLLGNREIVFPALEAGQIDVLTEYAATALEFVNGGAGEATADPAQTVQRLNAALEPKGLVALDHAVATDQNGYAVTNPTADQYGLAKISDLGKPAQ
jgi:osmoprotectant transport system substrate-binding protein